MQWRSAGALLAIVATGCSGQETAGQPADGGGSGGAGGADSGAAADQSVQEEAAASDASIDTGRRDSFIDIFDAFPIPDGQAGACAACVRDQCGAQVNACVNSDVCRNGLVCTVMTCLAGGGMPDLTCILGCFNGDTGAAFAAIGALMCINTSCGGACTPALDAGMPGDASTTLDAPSAMDAPSDANATGDAPVGDATPIDGGSPEDASSD